MLVNVQVLVAEIGPHLIAFMFHFYFHLLIGSFLRLKHGEDIENDKKPLIPRGWSRIFLLRLQ